MVAGDDGGVVIQHGAKERRRGRELRDAYVEAGAAETLLPIVIRIGVEIGGDGGKVGLGGVERGDGSVEQFV